MASDAQNTLYEIFAGLSQYAGGGVGGGLAGSAANEASSSGTNGAQGSKSGGSAAGTVVKDVLKSGFGLVSLVTSLAGLFGGDDGNTASPLVKYSLPAAREFEAAETGSGFGGLDYDQAGLPRVSDASRTAAIPPQVSVTVNAMDARSFLDRSTEIAAAVRDAMLNLNSINDVVNDL